MADKKIITVFGATGAQGGGLVRAILNDQNSGFSVRAITRDAGSEKAQKLREQGADVMEANLDDAESLKKALEGAYGAYFVTFFWDHFSPERELTEAHNLAKAAKDAGLKHVIWSTLEDSRQYIPLNDDRMPTLQGKYKVPHFDAKGEANQFFTELGLPVTFLLTSFYWENFIYFGMGPKKDQDGKLAISFPLGDKKMAGIASEDIGKSAYGIFKKGNEFIGKTVGIVGEHLSGEQFASAFSDALGQEIRYNAVTPETYRNFGFPGADDLGNMFQFYRDFEEVFSRSRSTEFTRSINPELKDFKSWLAENKARIPLE